MAPEEIAALAAQVDELDRETARRVGRLVLECNAGLRLALSAVREANRSARTSDTQLADRRENFHRWPLRFWNNRLCDLL